MQAARLKHYGWGREGEGMTPEERAFVWSRYQEKFGHSTFDIVPVPPLEALSLPTPRMTPPPAIAILFDRAL